MTKFAFIDVSNTNGTTKKILGFKIDWGKLHSHLRNKKWDCRQIYYYEGHQKGRKGERRLERIEKMGYIVRTKETHIHRGKKINISIPCPGCNKQIETSLIMSGNRKSNCDVELTADALEFGQIDNEVILFTGDGDFAYLIEQLIEKGAKVCVIASKGRDNKGNMSFSSRLTTILQREETNQTRRVRFVDINDWRMIIASDSTKKKSPTSVTTSESTINVP